MTKGDTVKRGEKIMVLEGKYAGFVGTVISSDLYNSDGHLVLKKSSRPCERAVSQADASELPGDDERLKETLARRQQMLHPSRRVEALKLAIAEELRGPGVVASTESSCTVQKLLNADDSENHGFRAGAPIFIIGLQTRADLNGRRGVIRRFLEKSGRFEVEIDGEPTTKALLPSNVLSSLYEAEADIPDDLKLVEGMGKRCSLIETYQTSMTADVLIEKLAKKGVLVLDSSLNGAKAQRLMIKEMAIEALEEAFGNMGLVGLSAFERQFKSPCRHLWMSLTTKERAAWCAGLNPAATSDSDLYFNSLPCFFDEDIVSVPKEQAFRIKSLDPADYSPQQARTDWHCQSVLRHLECVSRETRAEPPGAATCSALCRKWCDCPRESWKVPDGFDSVVRPAFARAVCAVLKQNPFELPKEMQLGFAMAQHKRLGTDSPWLGLPCDVIVRIVESAAGLDPCSELRHFGQTSAGRGMKDDPFMRVSPLDLKYIPSAHDDFHDRDLTPMRILMHVKDPKLASQFPKMAAPGNHLHSLSAIPDIREKMDIFKLVKKELHLETEGRLSYKLLVRQELLGYDSEEYFSDGYW